MKRQRIKIAIDNAEEYPVEAEIYGNFALHATSLDVAGQTMFSTTQWSVTHIPTGYAVCACTDEDTARRLANRLRRIKHAEIGEFRYPESVDARAREAMKRILWDMGILKEPASLRAGEGMMDPCQYCGAIQQATSADIESAQQQAIKYNSPRYRWRCAVCNEVGPWKHTTEEAIAAWNERAENAALKARVAALERAGRAAVNQLETIKADGKFYSKDQDALDQLRAALDGAADHSGEATDMIEIAKPREAGK